VHTWRSTNYVSMQKKTESLTGRKTTNV
jgi:hypothetical protein